MEKDLPAKSGIYCMYFDQVYNAYYIGCSISIRKRISNHFSDLKRTEHTNYKLQGAYNKYGYPNVEVLELCDANSIFDKEITYIEEFDSFNNGFNLTKGAEGRLFGENNGSAKHTEEEYKKVVMEIAYTDKSYRQISIETGVSRDIVKHIGNLSAHQYLQELCPEAYEILTTKYNNRDNSALSQGIVYPDLVSPLGIIHKVNNVHKFAEEHSLQYQNLHKVLTGKRLTHLGWKLDAGKY